MHALPILEEPAQVGTAADGSRYLRTGSCNRCGECCKSGDPFNGERGVGQVVGACPLYVEDEQRLGGCSDRSDSYYLNGCASWPSIPEHIVAYPSCTYRFERVE